jgi:hypothetical protein
MPGYTASILEYYVLHILLIFYRQKLIYLPSKGKDSRPINLCVSSANPFHVVTLL